MTIQLIRKSRGTGIALGLGLLALLLAGCSGSARSYKELRETSPHKEFTSLETIEEPPAGEIADGVRAKMKSATFSTITRWHNYVSEQRRLLGEKNQRKMTIVYKITSHDPGAPALRPFLGRFGIGGSTLTAEAKFLDESRKELAKIEVESKVSSRRSFWNDDDEQHGEHVAHVITNFYHRYFYKSKLRPEDINIPDPPQH